MNIPSNGSDNQDDVTLIARVLAGEREAFQAFLGLARLREPARFGAWFHAIAAHLARLERRRHRDHPLRPLEDDTVMQLWWSRGDPSFEEMVVARDIHDSIMTALQQLSEVNRQVVIGFYLQGYSYAELAQLLQVPVSTVKGRLFEGRRHLRATLQSIAEATLQPAFPHRKEPSMHSPEFVALEIDAIGEALPLTRQPVVVLREAQTQRCLAIRLTLTAAETLLAAVRSKQQPHSLPAPPDLTQQLVESRGATHRQVIIHALGKGTFYATLDAATSREPFLEARTGDPQSAGGLASALTLSAAHELSAMVREASPRLLQPFFFERVWAFLLEELTGTRAPVEPAQLQTLDLSTRLPTREVTREEQPMIAIHLPEPQETA